MRRPGISHCALLAALAAAGLASTLARADTPAIDVTTVGTYPPLSPNGFNYFQAPGNYTFIWDFTAKSAIDVTQLGYYNSALAGTPEPNGFGSHFLTLTDLTTDATLASATVTARNTANGFFNYAPIDAMRLNTTDTYEVSGTMTSQYYLVGLNQSTAPTASAINYLFGTGLNIFGGPAPPGTYYDFGPNFQFTPASRCTENVAGRNIIALLGDSCVAAPGIYNPTTTSVALPVTYNGFGFYAHGGSITSDGAIAINTSNPNSRGGSYGVWADTTGSLITLNGTSAITTVGVNSHGVYASGGGQINSPGALSVASNGIGAFGVYASGAGSAITAAIGSISMTGANSAGARADGGGHVSLTGGSVTTSGVNGVGLLASGVNSIVSATNVAVSTSGGGSAQALLAESGGALITNGGSASTSGRDVYVAAAVDGGSLRLTGTAIEATGLGAGGIAVNGAISALDGNNLTIVTHGDYDSANSSGAAGVANQGSGEVVGGGNVQLTNSTITTLGSAAIGAVNLDSGQMRITGGAINTSGARSDGVYTGGGSTTNLAGVAITTSGAGAKGLIVRDAGTTLNGSNLTVVTSETTANGGFQADALYNGNGGGAGAGSTGGATVSLTASSFTTHGDRASGVVTENGGSTTLTRSSVATSGVQASAVYGSSGSSTTLNNVTLTTTGNAAKGIDIEGTGTTLNGANLTITTSGTIDPATGFHAQGVYNGSSVPAVAGRTGGGTVALIDSRVTTHGDVAYGVDTANGGSTSFSGGSIATSGVGAIALLATSGATTAVAPDSDGQGATISTTGRSALGALAGSGAAITLTGATISTHGDGSTGLAVRDSGSSVTASKVTITTTGGHDATSGLNALGAYNGPGSTGTSGGNLTLDHVSVSTSGFGADAVRTEAGGATTITGGVFTTSGQSSAAMSVVNSGALTINGAALASSGAASVGLDLAGAGGHVSANNVTIAETGDGLPGQAQSVAVFNGANGLSPGNGVLRITDSAITTSGVQALGLFTGSQATTILQGVTISTSGAGSLAVAAAGGTTTLEQDEGGVSVAISTTGASATGAIALRGGALSITGGSISTAGDGSAGLAVNDAGSSATATNVTISTKGGLDAATGRKAYGVYNGPGPTGTSGGNLALANVIVTTQGDQSAAFVTGVGGVTTATGGAFSTAGANAAAVSVLKGGTLTISGAALTTTGAGAAGLTLNGGGGKVTASNLTISTSGGVSVATGSHADGVYNGSFGSLTGGGIMSVTDSTVRTAGAQAYGVSVGAGGRTTFLGGSIATSGAGADAARANNGGILNIRLDQAGVRTQIATTGVASAGALASNQGAIVLDGATIATTGDGSVGLAVYDAGSSASATNVRISTKGGLDIAAGLQAYGVYNGPGSSGTSGSFLTLADVIVTTQGDRVDAFSTLAGGKSTATGGAFSTAGAGATAVSVLNGGALQISGAALTTSGDGASGLIVNGMDGGVISSVIGGNLTIATSGGVWSVNGAHADGVYNGPSGSNARGGSIGIADSAVTTSGAQAYGVEAGVGGTTSFLGGTIATSGLGANAARAENGGRLFFDVGTKLQATTISTSGAGAYAAVAVGGGKLSLIGATIATTGDGSGGLGVNGAGSEIDATGVTISTKGGFDSASGLHAYGAANSPHGSFASGGVLNLTNVAISTAGDAMYGVYTGASSTTTYAGGSAATSGANADALHVTGAGASLTASGVALSTTGAAAYGAAAVNGGALTLGDQTQVAASGLGAHGLYVAGVGSTASLSGAVAISATGAGAAGVYVDAGGAVASAGPLSIFAKTHGVFLNGATGDATIPAAFGASGPLSVKTTDASGAALTLSGNSVTFAATGGGLIQAAGTGVAFLNGVNQSAVFKNFEIDTPAGDLIFADPAAATIAFDNSLANAGSGNLAHVVGGSDLNLTALASTLIGAVVTEPGSSSTMTLAGGSVWTVTGNSTVNNLNLVNSSAMFAPSTSGFHTLTVDSYVGTGAGLTFNAVLGGAHPGADQLIINGGQAVGSTTISIRQINQTSAQAIGAASSAAAAPASSVPIVVTTNGGAIAPNAFTLAGPVVAGDTVYSLQQQPGGEFLVGNQGQSSSQLSGSLASLSQSRQSQAVTTRVLGSILTGATEQINCSSCSSGFASFGSFALGVHGRWTLSPSVALIAGLSYDNYTAPGVTVNNALLGALGVRYDMVELGKYRPFFETGVAVSPYANVTFRRSYVSNIGSGVGVGNTLSRSVAAFGRAGYIWRLSQRDEAALYTDLSRSWQSTGGYLESPNPGNPFGALVEPSLDTMNIWKVGAQFTHLFGDHIEANVSAGYALAFDSKYRSTASLAGLTAAGAAAASFDWAELGGRLSYRFSKNVIADVFVLGTVGAEPAGSQIHGGLALRMAF